MFVKEYGHGAQLVLGLHGWGGDHREFATLAPHLPADIRLLCPDLPGYGRSPRPDPLTLESILSPLAALLDRCSAAGPCILMGYCSGAALALLLAQRRPADVSRLVLIEPLACMPWYFKLFLAGRPGRLAFATAFQGGPGRRVVNGLLGLFQPAGEDFTQGLAQLDAELALGYLACLRPLGLKDLTLAGVPVEIAVGEQTFRAVRRSARLLGRRLQPSRVLILAGAGHLPLKRCAHQLSRLLAVEAAPVAQ